MQHTKTVPSNSMQYISYYHNFCPTTTRHNFCPSTLTAYVLFDTVWFFDRLNLKTLWRTLWQQYVSPNWGWMLQVKFNPLPLSYKYRICTTKQKAQQSSKETSTKCNQDQSACLPCSITANTRPLYVPSPSMSVLYGTHTRPLTLSVTGRKSCIELIWKQQGSHFKIKSNKEYIQCYC